MLFCTFSIITVYSNHIYTFHNLWYDIFFNCNWVETSGNSTVPIYTHTIHRTTQSTQTVYRTTQLTSASDFVYVGLVGKPVWPLWPFSVADDKSWTAKGHDHPV